MFGSCRCLMHCEKLPPSIRNNAIRPWCAVTVRCDSVFQMLTGPICPWVDHCKYFMCVNTFVICADSLTSSSAQDERGLSFSHLLLCIVIFHPALKCYSISMHTRPAMALCVKYAWSLFLQRAAMSLYSHGLSAMAFCCGLCSRCASPSLWLDQPDHWWAAHDMNNKASYINPVPHNPQNTVRTLTHYLFMYYDLMHKNHKFIHVVFMVYLQNENEQYLCMTSCNN